VTIGRRVRSALAALVASSSSGSSHPEGLAEERMRRAHLAALLDINAKIAALAPTGTLLASIAEEAARLLRVDNAGFRLLEGDDLVVAGLAGSAGEVMIKPRIKVGESFTGAVVAKGHSLRGAVGEFSSILAEHLAAEQRLGYTHLLGVPLRLGERTIGALTFRARRPFTDADQELAEAFAGQAAVAIEHSRLFHEATRQAGRMQALMELGRLLTQSLDPDAVARRIVDNTCRLLRAQNAMLLRLDERTGELISMAVGGDAGLMPPGGFVFPYGMGLPALALRERTAVTTPDLLADPRVVLSPDLRGRIERAGYRAALAVPLLVRDRVIGALAVGARPDHVFDAEEVSLAQAFATEAAVAMDNAQLYAEATRRGREASELATLAGHLTESLRVDEISERIVAALVGIFRVRSANIRRLAADGSLEVIARGGHGGSVSERGTALGSGVGISGRVLATGRAFATTDVLDEREITLPRELQASIRASGDRAYLAVPMRAKGVVIGTVLLNDHLGRAFTAADAALLQTIADQCALALENARLYEESDRRRREAEVIGDVARGLNEALDLDTVLQRVTEAARDLCRADIALIALRELGSATMIARHVIGARVPQVNTTLVEPGKGAGGVVITTGQPFRTDDYLADPRITTEYRENMQAEGVVSQLIVPMLSAGRVEGLLYVENRSPRPFTDRDEAILLQLADHATVAVTNARLYAAESERTVRLRTLDRLNHLVSSSLDPEEVLSEVARAAGEFMHSAVVVFWLADESARTLRAAATSTPDASAFFLNRTVAYGEGIAGRVAARRLPLNVADVFASDAAVLYTEWLRDQDLRSLIAIPVIDDDLLLAVVSLAAHQPFDLSPDDHELLESLLTQAAAAIRNAALYAESDRRRREAEVLAEVARSINASLDVDTVLDRVTAGAREVCASDMARISLREPDGSVVARASVGYRSDVLMRLRVEPGHGVGGLVLVTGKPFRTADYVNDPRISARYRAVSESEGTMAAMAVPIVIDGRVEGIVHVDNRSARPFTDQDEAVLTRLAEHAAVALRNARLYRETAEFAERLRALDEVNRLVSSSLNPDEVLRNIAAAAARFFDAPFVSMWVSDESGHRLLRSFTVGNDELAARLPTELAIGEGTVGWVAAHREPLFWTHNRDGRIVRGVGEHFEAHGLHYRLVYPVTIGERVLGVITANRATPLTVTPETEALLRSLAAQAAFALDHARLFTETSKRLTETQTLLAVAEILSQSGPPEDVMRRVARELGRTTSAGMVGAYVFNERRDALIPLAGYRVPAALRATFSERPMTLARFPLIAEALASGRTAWTADAHADRRLDRDWTEGLPPYSALFVPTLAQGQPLGGLFLVWWETGRPYPAAEVPVVEGVATQAGVALENARLFAANRRQVEELSVLYDLSRAVTGQLDRAALVDAIHTHLGRVMDVANMTVLIRDEDANELTVALRIRQGRRNDDPPRRYPPTGIGLLEVVLEGRPLRTARYAEECEERGVAPVEYGLGFRHWMGVPMKAGNVVLGAIAMRTIERPYTDTDERLLGNVADLAALALRSARLYEERASAFRELSAAQDQLVRTEKLRALGEMASGVAHDFNNLLASILGRAQLLLQRIDDPKLRRWCEVIERSALDGAQTVRRLQEFTRIRRDDPFVAVDLNRIVGEALEITQSRWRDEAMSRGVAVEVRTSFNDVPPVAGDPVELREALTNLVLNAVDAMPDGGVLSLRTELAEDRVELTIADTGVGMSEDVRQRIFDPFFTTKGAQGTGLGLSITYGILMRHRAQVTVDSAPGQGTTFRLSFAQGVFPEPTELATAPAVPASAQLRCLVVDDEEAVGAVLGDVLESSGHTAVVLTNPHEAVERVGHESFDVVFTDLAMPGLSGWQVARAVKSASPATPVFLVTGFAVELSAEERVTHGVDLVLAKPLNIQSILDAVAFAATRRVDGA
jgi:GAF domain-containing protein/CheY-like chemotaxis protein